MKLTISVLLVLIVGATAQNSEPQLRGLNRLADNGNPQLVGTCTPTAAILLTCPLVGNSLPITDQVHATSIRFGIRLCESSLLVNLTLSNGTVLTAVDFAQNDNSVTFGQLMLAIKIAVCTDVDDLTVITTSVNVNSGTRLFNSTMIPLSEQPDNCEEIPPFETCSGTTTFYGSLLLIFVAFALTLLYNVSV